MGPRAKRRLAIGAIAALIIAAGVTAVLATRPGRSSSDQQAKGSGQPAKEVYGTFGAFGISDGMRGDQVVARLGEPDRKRSSCWVYDIHGGTFAGIKVLPQLAIDAVEYCFYNSGNVEIILDHWHKVNGVNPFTNPWQPPMTWGCGGKPCQPPQ